jgi:hypothetical protein
MVKKLLGLFLGISLVATLGAEYEWKNIGLEGEAVITELCLDEQRERIYAVSSHGQKISVKFSNSSEWETIFLLPQRPCITDMILLSQGNLCISVYNGYTPTSSIYIGTPVDNPPYVNWERVHTFPERIIINSLASCLGEGGEVIYAGSGKGLYSCVVGNYNNWSSLEIPEYSFGVEMPRCSDILALPSRIRIDDIDVFACGYDTSPLPGRPGVITNTHLPFGGFSKIGDNFSAKCLEIAGEVYRGEIRGDKYITNLFAGVRFSSGIGSSGPGGVMRYTPLTTVPRTPNWTSCGLEGKDVRDISYTPPTGEGTMGTLYAATNSGIYRAFIPLPSDGNQSFNWQELNQGLTDTDVYCLLTKDNEIKYASTSNGVFEYTRSSSIEKPISEIIPSLQNYPNPFNPKCWLPDQIQITKVRIYDILGRLVGELDDLPELPSGVYFYEIHPRNNKRKGSFCLVK